MTKKQTNVGGGTKKTSQKKNRTKVVGRKNMYAILPTATLGVEKTLNTILKIWTFFIACEKHLEFGTFFDKCDFLKSWTVLKNANRISKFQIIFKNTKGI
jgi:hypothetical protein